jgi:patatin-like phospholipase/acyl hydrolase
VTRFPARGQRLSEERFQLLSLSGGGFRGLFTACVLAELEVGAKRPIGRSFELIAGTSIGGIIALAVAFEVPLAKVVSSFQTHGERIFPPRGAPGPISSLVRTWRDYRGAPYSPTGIRDVVEELLGKDTKLGDALHPVLVPAVNLTQGAPQIFKTRHHVDFDRDWRLKAVDVALATSAAPTFFPPARILPFIPHNPIHRRPLRDHLRVDPEGLFAAIQKRIAVYVRASTFTKNLPAKPWYRRFVKKRRR